MQGSCYCGQVRYRFDGEVLYRTLCHCSICRRVTGAPSVAWVTVPRASLRFVDSQPQWFASTADGTRGFCARCGTHLVFVGRRTPDEIDITTCSLDNVEALPPQDHTWVRSKPSWVQLCDGLPQLPEDPHDPATEA